MLYLSVSAVKDYLACPKIYWYRVHKKEAFISDEFIFRGNVIHKVIETCDNEDDAILSLNNMYRNSYSYTTDLKLKNELEAIKMVHNYYTLIEPYLGKRYPNVIEKQFKIPWSNNVYLVGKIDRFDLNTNKIYDWKTSMQPPDAYELQDMQFYVYTWAYEVLYRVKPTVYYGHLNSGTLFPIDIHDDMWYNIKRLIDELVIKLTDEKSFYPRLFGYKCKRCFYKGACLSDYELGN